MSCSNDAVIWPLLPGGSAAGAVHVERQLDDSPLEVVRLLGSRRRVRRTQGFTPDDLDMAAAGMAGLILSALAIA